MKKKGFTLIELLAVIIILGILMLIAIPSVTSYINNARKSTYVDTVNEIIKGTTTLVNSGEIEVNDPNATYYIPCSCVELESGGRSPYGEFDPAYVAVVYNGDNYSYYFTSRDTQGMGIKKLTYSDLLEASLIEGNIEKEDIRTDVGVGSRGLIKLLKSDCETFEDKEATELMTDYTEPEPRNVLLIKGEDLNKKFKKLSGSNNPSYNTENTAIKHIRKVNELPKNMTMTDENIVSTEDSEFVIYAWFSGDSINIYSEYPRVYFNPDSKRALSYMKGLEDVDFNSIEITKIENFDQFFYYASNYSNLNWDNKKMPNLETIRDAFYGSGFVNISMKRFSFGTCTSLTQLFYSLPKLKTIDLSYADMSNVITCDHLFYYSYYITDIVMKHVNLQNCKQLNHLCYECERLVNIDLSDCITPNVEQMHYMFKFCYKLESVDFHGLDMSNVKTFQYVFVYCHQLKSLDLSYLRTPKLEQNAYMFSDCPRLEYLNISNWGSDYLYWSNQMVYSCDNLKTLIIRNFNFGVSSSFDVYDYSNNIETIDFTGSDFSHVRNIYSHLVYGSNGMKTLILKDCKFGENVASAFKEGKEQYLDLSGADFSLATNLDHLFSDSPNLKSINLTGTKFNNNITNMNSIFYGCSSLESIDLSVFKTSSVTNMSSAFYGCRTLTKLDLSTWDLSRVQYTSSMVSNMPSLVELVTPKNNALDYIYLPFNMYARGNSSPISELSSSTPTRTTLKNTQWS